MRCTPAEHELNLIKHAVTFATAAHAAVGQRRKYTDEPYIVHPRAVAELVAEAGGTPEMICAAWLHDVVEDTQCALTDIRSMFGSTVGDYVGYLSDMSTPADGNRTHRKGLERERLAQACPEVKTIKLADLIDNTSSITQHDPEFAKVYMAEKKELIWCLKEGDHTLLCRAMGLIMDYEQGRLDKKLEVTKHEVWWQGWSGLRVYDGSPGQKQPDWAHALGCAPPPPGKVGD